jgi:hypothetical protein
MRQSFTPRRSILPDSRGSGPCFRPARLR